MDKDTKLFDDVAFSDLIKDVYNNSKRKERQIDGLVDQLKGLIKNVNDAGMLVSLIKEYLEVSVKNDDNLVKLTAIVQRLMSSAGRNEDGETTLSETERAQLMEAAEELIEDSRAA